MATDTGSKTGGSARRWLRGAGELAALLLVIAAAKTAIAEPFYVPSGSMEPTLQIGDELLAAKFSYGYSAASLPFGLTVPESGRVLGRLPARGDVVVFRWPGDPSQTWVKRVIGLPGDRIALQDGRVWINGAPVGLRPDGEGRVEHDNGATVPAVRMIETLPGGVSHPVFKLYRHGPLDEMAEITVPPGNLFVMGDNRDNSADSRLPVSAGGVGLLPVGDLVGKAEFVVGSWDLGRASQPVWTWPAGLRLDRFLSAIE
ncbi:signal peptidase I [Inquilinus limosus]|uniref:Signal peptidase I n=1 Tax=Inquilinus limosus MP06 TaxID=1398085 RepID=A0A0A0D5P3_9PROT|nr:signal peptidase I [Inquilinus limosus]KGM32337.1 signal peptidase I [Inquilinus limosus MP06]